MDNALDRIYAWKYFGQNTEGQWRSSLGACPTNAYDCNGYLLATPAREAAEDMLEALEAHLVALDAIATEIASAESHNAVIYQIVRAEIDRITGVLARAKGGS